MKKATSSGRPRPSASAFLMQDRDAHLQLGRLDRDGQTPAEARDQPVFHSADFLRVGVAGDDHLLVRFDQRIEGVEELLLGAVLAAEELDVVDQQQIQRVVVLLEAVEGLVLVGAHYVGHVLLGVNVADLGVGIAILHQVADGLKQVGLAQAHATVDEQRVVGGAGMLGDLQRGGPRELIGLAGDERVEREGRVQAAGLAHPRSWFPAPAQLPGRRAAGAGWAAAALRELQRDGELALLMVLGELLDDRKKAILDPLQDESVGRLDDQVATGDAGLQRLNPGLELLVRQGLLEMLEAKSPEGVHRRRGARRTARNRPRARAL